MDEVNQNGWKIKALFFNVEGFFILSNTPRLNLSQRPARRHIFGVAAAIIIVVTYAILAGKLPTTRPVYADSAKVVSLYADGQKRIFTTDATTVGDLLTRTSITLGPHDLVEPAASSPIPAGFFNVNVYRARPVLVVDGLNSKVVQSAHASPHLIAKDAGITTYPQDTFNDAVVTNFATDDSVGEKVTIIRAKPITLSVDGTTKTIRTQATTVGSFLKSAGIAMGTQDTTSLPLTQAVVPGADLVITRVSDVTVTKHEPIAFVVKTVKDPNFYLGQSQIAQAGVVGGRDVTYHIRYNDGVEVARNVVSAANVVNPIDQITHTGTKVRFAGSIEYWRPQVQVAAAASGVDPNLMLEIMDCESHGNAGAANASGHYGLYQYDATTWAAVGGTMANIYDGSTQISKTAAKIARSGTGAWAASRSCWVNY